MNRMVASRAVMRRILVERIRSPSPSSHWRRSIVIRPIVLLFAAFAAGSAVATMPSDPPLLRVVDVIGSPPATNPAATPQAGYTGPPARRPAPGKSTQLTPPTSAVSPPQPAPLGSCDGGGCWDSGGNRYNSTGDGSRFLDKNGKLCTASGKFMTCN